MMWLLQQHKVYVIIIACVIVIFASLFVQSLRSKELFQDDRGEAQNIANAVESVVKRFNITSICDMACGNCEWVPLLLDKHPSLKYTGYECDPSLVDQGKKTLSNYENARVHLADPATANPASADLLLSWKYLETLSFMDIRRAMVRFANYDCKFYALGNYAFGISNNKNIETGATSFKLNLEKHPFNMSPAFISTEGANDKLLFGYTSTQMKGFVERNSFWTSDEFARENGATH
jgi:hypothetical protein